MRPLATLCCSLFLVRPARSFVSHRATASSSSLAYYSWLAATTASSSYHHNPFFVLAANNNDIDSSCPTTTTSRRMASSSSSKKKNVMTTGFLNAADAAALDVELMSTPGFSLEQLMELAGLSVAEAVYQVLEEQRQASDKNIKHKNKPRILIVCGPGNNGGDGLVAGRHLVMFGYDVDIVYPKPSTKQQHFSNLVQQCQDVGISIATEMPAASSLSNEYDAIVDAMFGFSFKGVPRVRAVLYWFLVFCGCGKVVFFNMLSHHRMLYPFLFLKLTWPDLI